MMKKYSVTKKILSAALCVIMLMGMIPAIPWELKVEAATTADQDYVVMPIKIRDYAADGMLFEANELESTGTSTYNGKTFLHYSNSSFGLLASNPGATYMNNAIGIMGSNTYGGNKSQTLDNLKLGTIGSINLAGAMKNNDPEALYSDNTWLGTKFYRNGKWGTSYNQPETITLNSGATQTLYGGILRVDLVEPYLHEDGSLLYRKEIVDYLAYLLQTTLIVPQIDPKTGYYNMHYVMGQKLDVLGGRDVAQVIRDQIKKTADAGGDVVGTYEASYERYENESLYELTDIQTYYDAAYFLLHDMFYDGQGYGTVVDCYNEMRLIAKDIVDENGVARTVYVFNSGYDEVDYNYKEGYIANTQTTKITYHENNETKYKEFLRGNPWYANRFNPISDDLMAQARAYHSGDEGKEDWFYGYGQSGDVYNDYCGKTIGSNQAQYYETTNYHTSIEGRAQFIYYHDQDLYFSFTGDDDVYLYINGVRVLDVGGAHAITKVKVSLNDVAALCGLEDGKAYDFDFFYLERHGTAANFSVETNIKIVDPAMTTYKSGYQFDAEVGFGGLVSAKYPVTYRFGLENKGQTVLTNLTFEDKDINCYIGYDDVRLNSETEITDLIVTRYQQNGMAAPYVYITSAEQLQAELAKGLALGESIYIYGFDYTIPAEKWVGQDGSQVFVNRVQSTAEAPTQGTSKKTLHSLAEYAVTRSLYLIDPLHVYTWGKIDEDRNFITPTRNGEPVTIEKQYLVDILQYAHDEFGNKLVNTYIDDWVLDMNAYPSTAPYVAAAGYGSQKLLHFFNYGTYYDISLLEEGGVLDMSQYSMIQVEFGADPNSKFSDRGTKFVLTTNGAYQNSDGTINPNAEVIASQVLSNSTGRWADKNQRVTMAFDSEHKGKVYLNLYMGDGNGLVVTSVKMWGKDAPGIEINYETATISLCSSSGVIGAHNVNQRAYVNEHDWSITYTPTEVGDDTYYYMVNGVAVGSDEIQSFGPVPVNVYTYGACDDAFVLDYGLPVTVTEEGGIYDNNVMFIPDNKWGTGHSIDVTAATSQYGIYSTDINNQTLTYTMNGFMNGVDSMDLAITIRENGTDPSAPVTKFTGVVMTQSVELAPASVMYYEDTFPAVNYLDDAERLNIWQAYDGRHGKPEQSIDQSLNYGSDPAYRFNTSFSAASRPGQYPLQNMLDVEDIIYGDASNDTIHKLDIRNTKSREIVQFTFTGTGFEILSRTTPLTYGVLTVKVENQDESGEWQIFKMIPVITESIGGDLYQIPIIDRKDMPYDEYRVTVYASNGRANDPEARQRVVYIDGIRVYQPLEKSLQDRYYNTTEANAKFYEIKTQIKYGNVVYGEVFDATPDDEPLVTNTTVTPTLGMMFGFSMIESYRGSKDPNAVPTLTNTLYADDATADFPLYGTDEYMKYGPNNEIYLRGVEVGVNFMAFYVVKDPAVADGERTIQVGAHVKYNAEDDQDILFDENGSVDLVYGSTAEQMWNGTHTVEVSSGTEQYITIEESALIEVGGKYLVMIGTNDSAGTLALTNFKLKGYTLAGTYENATGDDITDVAPVSPAVELNAILDVYDINASTLAKEAVALADLYKAQPID